MKLLLFCFVCGFVTAIEAAAWSYDETMTYGPLRWGDFNPNCAGQKQSPINIVSATSVQAISTGPIKVLNIDKIPTTVTVTNDGHGVAISSTFAFGGQPEITGGPLKAATYTFHNLHFHWKSEHTVNGQQYDAESHLVFFNSKYGNFTEAVKYADGLTVLGFLYSVPSGSTYDTIRPFIKATENVFKPASAYVEKTFPFSLFSMIETRIFSIWNYSGSLTTPSCNQVVTWMVYKNPIPIYPSEMKILKQLQDDDGIPVQTNCRPTQPLNGRTVYHY